MTGAQEGLAGRVRVGRAGDISPGHHKLVKVHGSEVGIYNLDGEFHAIRNYCPHRGAPICEGIQTGTMVPTRELGKFEWGLEGRVLRCPWHRWEFDIVTGNTLFGIDKRRLIRYEVRVEDGELFLYLGARERRRAKLAGDAPAVAATNQEA